MSSFRSDFRRSVQTDTKKKAGGGGKKGFYERFWLEKDAVAAMLLLKGDYVDPWPAQELVQIDPNTGHPIPIKTVYKKFRKHQRKLLKNGHERFIDEVCSAGTEAHNPQPCVGCLAMDTGDKSIKLMDQFALGIVHLAYYHGHPMIDRQTHQFVQKQQDKSYVIIFDECEGRVCNFCRTLQGQPPILQQGEQWPQYPPGSISTIFGKRRYLELGKNHLQDIFTWDTSIGHLCAACRSEMVVDGFACGACHQMVIDLSQDPRTDEQIKEAINHPYPCMYCRQTTTLDEVCACENCEAQGRKGVQLGVFDVVVFGTKTGEGTNSHLTLGPRQFTSLEEFGRTVDPAYYPGKTFLQHIQELAQPYDFDKMLEPRSLQDQSKNLELPMPGQQGQAGYMPYGAPSAYAASGAPGFPAPGPTPGFPPGAYPQPQPGYAQPVPTPAPYAPYPQQGVAPQPQPQPNMPVGYPPPGRPNYS